MAFHCEAKHGHPASELLLCLECDALFCPEGADAHRRHRTAALAELGGSAGQAPVWTHDDIVVMKVVAKILKDFAKANKEALRKLDQGAAGADCNPQREALVHNQAHVRRDLQVAGLLWQGLTYIYPSPSADDPGYRTEDTGPAAGLLKYYARDLQRFRHIAARGALSYSMPKRPALLTGTEQELQLLSGYMDAADRTLQLLLRRCREYEAHICALERDKLALQDELLTAQQAEAADVQHIEHAQGPLQKLALDESQSSEDDMLRSLPSPLRREQPPNREEQREPTPGVDARRGQNFVEDMETLFERKLTIYNLGDAFLVPLGKKAPHSEGTGQFPMVDGASIDMSKPVYFYIDPRKKDHGRLEKLVALLGLADRDWTCHTLIKSSRSETLEGIARQLQ